MKCKLLRDNKDPDPREGLVVVCVGYACPGNPDCSQTDRDYMAFEYDLDERLDGWRSNDADNT